MSTIERLRNAHEEVELSESALLVELDQKVRKTKHDVPSMFPACYQHVTSMLPACYHIGRYARSMLSPLLLEMKRECVPAALALTSLCCTLSLSLH